VLWHLSLDGGVPDYAIDGGSLGAAFAVGLRELLRRPRGSRWGALEVPISFFVGLRPRYAITGVLTEQQPTGYEGKAPPGAVGPWLGKVGDWDTKLEAAKAKGLRLIAPAANESDSGEGGVDWAYTAPQADRYARQVRPVRTAVAAAAVLAVLGAAAGIGTVAQARSGESSADAQAAQQHAAALSEQLAAQGLSLDTTDPLTARQLAVAAWSVSHTSQAESAMTTMLVEQQRNGTLPLTNASAAVREVALSPDGKLLAAVDVEYASFGSGTVQLWDLATDQPAGKPLPVAIDLNGDVDKVAFSPDGKLLATANTNGTVGLWNTANGRPVEALRVDPDGGTPNEVAFSPDGKLLATSDTNGTVRAWNVASGQPAGPSLPVETGSQGGLAFSPDDKLLATADSEDGTVQLWNPVTGQLVAGFLATASVPNNNVGEIAFSPDGKLLITADGIDGTVSLWNPVTRQLVRVIPRIASAEFYSTMTFSLHGEVLTVDEANTARSWDIATGQPTGPSFRADVGAAGNSDEAAISPNGQILVADASNPAGGGSVAQLWNLATRQPFGAPLSEGANSAYELAFSPNGKLLAAAETDGTVQLLDPATGQRAGPSLAADTHDQAGMAFSPDGKLLATADNTGYDSEHGGGIVRLWNPSTGKPVGTPLSAAASPGGRVNGLAFSPDGKFIATVDVSSSGQTVQLWNPATGQPVGSAFPVDSNSLDRVAGMAFSPDGKLLAIAEEDIGSSGGTVRLWAPDSGRAVGGPLFSTTGAVTGLAFSPKGGLLATAVDASGYSIVQLWNPATGRPTGAHIRVDTGSSYGVNSVEFSPDGKLLATAGNDPQAGVGGLVQLWNPATGQPVGLPLSADTGSSGTVDQLAFSPDGKLLATDDWDGQSQGTILLWQMPPLENPYAALCARVGPLTPAAWDSYAPKEPFPKMCN
jgi:WD40 repeat protein